MNGYIKLYRTIMENPIWADKPFSKGQAWVDLLMLANWNESKALVGNHVVTLNRGDVGRSQQYLADRWGWSRKKVALFLKFMEKEQMVAIKGTTKGTTLSIENYSKYQDEGTAQGTTEEHQKHIKSTHINKNNKNKKEKEFYIRENKEKVGGSGAFATAWYNPPDPLTEEETTQLLKSAHEQFAPIKAALMKEAVNG